MRSQLPCNTVYIQFYALLYRGQAQWDILPRNRANTWILRRQKLPEFIGNNETLLLIHMVKWSSTERRRKVIAVSYWSEEAEINVSDKVMTSWVTFIYSRSRWSSVWVDMCKE